MKTPAMRAADIGNAGDFREFTFPPSRLSTMDVCELGRKKHHIAALLEIDVTDARAYFKRYRENRGEGLSFTAWIVYCVAATASRNPQAAAYLKPNGRSAVSGSMDVSVMVEKDVGESQVPFPLVVRKCDEKSVFEIHKDIRQAQEENVSERTVVLNNGMMQRGINLFYKAPAFLRRFVFTAILRRPEKAIQKMGSIVVTSLGMFGSCDGWFIPIGIHPLCIAVGSVTKKPGIKDDMITVREYLKLTVLIDHDVIDGAPAARLLTQLSEMMTSCRGLETTN